MILALALGWKIALWILIVGLVGVVILLLLCLAVLGAVPMAMFFLFTGGENIMPGSKSTLPAVLLVGCVSLLELSGCCQRDILGDCIHRTPGSMNSLSVSELDTLCNGTDEQAQKIIQHSSR